MTSAALSTFIHKNFSASESRPSTRFIEITLSHDCPLFGFHKDEKVLVDSALSPKNGQLVVLARNDSYEVYRYETASGGPTLWPGNQTLSESEKNCLFVLIRETSEHPLFDVALYF